MGSWTREVSVSRSRSISVPPVTCTVPGNCRPPPLCGSERAPNACAGRVKASSSRAMPSAKASARSRSTESGRCGPCCSTALMGHTTVRPRTASVTWVLVRSVTRRGAVRSPLMPSPPCRAGSAGVRLPGPTRSRVSARMRWRGVVHVGVQGGVDLGRVRPHGEVVGHVPAAADPAAGQDRQLEAAAAQLPDGGEHQGFDAGARVAEHTAQFEVAGGRWTRPLRRWCR